jgi:hypothetical protein
MRRRARRLQRLDPPVRGARGTVVNGREAEGKAERGQTGSHAAQREQHNAAQRGCRHADTRAFISALLSG